MSEQPVRETYEQQQGRLKKDIETKRDELRVERDAALGKAADAERPV